MLLILFCLAAAVGISLVARDTVGEASTVPFGILAFTLLLFATGAL